MKVYAFIPARAGSKRVPGKNLRTVGGVSLLARAIDSAMGANLHTVVSTDGDLLSPIAMAAIDDGAVVHLRPPQLATDHAQIEAAVAHWWTRLDDKPDAIVLLQPTSPFRTAEHVREALRLLEVTGADSVVAVRTGAEHHFAGRMKPREAADGSVWYQWQPFRDVNRERIRTQDLGLRGTEDGMWAFTRAHWERTGIREGGTMAALGIKYPNPYDIDEEDDLRAADALARAGVP